MTLKTRLTVIVGAVLLGLSLAACSPPASSSVHANTATPIKEVTVAKAPSATPLPPTDTLTSLPPTETPLPTDTATSLPPTALPTAKVVAKYLNLRAGPGTAYPIVNMLKEGDVLTVLGRTPDNGWIAVKVSDTVTGWVSAQSKFVSLDVAVNRLAIVPSPSLPKGAVVTAAGVPAPGTASPPTQARPTQALPTEAPAPTPTTEPSPAASVQQFTLYFYFGAEGCPYSRTMAPRIEQFYQQYGYHGSSGGGVLGLSLSAGLGSPLVLPPLQGTIQWDVIGVPVGWWGGDPAAFRSATGVTFPFGADPGLGVDTSRIPVVVLYNRQTGVYRTATVGVVAYSTLVNQTTTFSRGTDIGASAGSS